MLEELYQELLMEHAKNPQNFGAIAGENLNIHLYNPLCGDEIHLYLSLQDNQVADIKFTGNGCSISQAAASLLTELVRGKSLEQLKHLADSYRKLITGKLSDEARAELGDLVVLEGVKKYPVRGRCALLCLEGLDVLVKRHELHCAEQCGVTCPEACPR